MNRICFGMPTLLECPSIEDSAALCQELGLDFIELNQNLPAYQPDSINLLRIRDVLEQHSLFATLHLDENLNPFDFNGYAARAYQETAQAAVRAAPTGARPLLPGLLPRLRRVSSFAVICPFPPWMTPGGLSAGKLSPTERGKSCLPASILHILEKLGRKLSCTHCRLVLK